MTKGLERLLKKKLDAIKSGKAPAVLDLFAGCGGLSLGFHTVGFETVGAVENDPFAIASYAHNFLPKILRRDHPFLTKPTDITVTEPGELCAELGLRQLDASIDVLIGGPPCQAFARVGRAKLREIDAHPQAFLRDPRSNLYLRFLHYVRQFKPLAILMENVPDALNHGGHNVAEETCEVLRAEGYSTRYTLLNAVFYGVPQMRERMFLIAYSDVVGKDVSFPLPTHWIKLPQGYEGSRKVALKALLEHSGNLFQTGEVSGYLAPPVSTPDLKPAVSAREALKDLPPITSHLEGSLRRGARRFTEKVPYRKNGKISDYAVIMREWAEFEATDGIYDHVIRSLPRDYEIFRRMNPGDQYPQAHEHAIKLFEERLAAAAAEGQNVRRGSAAYDRIKRETIPPYDPGKFPNKWRKMEADQPARTLMAHLGKDSYSHIHYDDSQARTISVREAARLQSFPDGFVFKGTMNPAFRQIGNAVPPLLAKAIAEVILSDLRT